MFFFKYDIFVWIGLLLFHRFLLLGLPLSRVLQLPAMFLGLAVIVIVYSILRS